MLRAIENAKVVTPDAVLEGASVIIEEGVIRGVSRRAQRGPGRLDAGGGYVLPGLVDLHSDAIEKHLAPRPGVEFPPELAFLEMDRHFARCGVTTGFHAVSFMRDSRRSVPAARGLCALIQARRTEASVRHELHLRCELPQEEAARAAIEAIKTREPGVVALMEHTPGKGKYSDPEWLRRLYAGDVSKDESDLLAALDEARSGEAADIPALADEVARAAQRGGAAIFSHDDDTPERVERMSRLGAGVSEFPVTADAARKAKDLGLHVCMGAPNVVRGRSHGGSVPATEAVRLGLVDALCSDYHPPSLLQSAFKLASEGVLDLPRAVSLITRGPSRAAGLCGRGEIREGADADLILVGQSCGLPVVTRAIVGGRVVAAIGAPEFGTERSAASGFSREGKV